MRPLDALAKDCQCLSRRKEESLPVHEKRLSKFPSRLSDFVAFIFFRFPLENCSSTSSPRKPEYSQPWRPAFVSRAGRRPCAPACTVPAGRSPPAAWSPTAPHPPTRGTGSGGAVRRGRGGGRLLCHRRHEEAAEPRASRSGGCPPHLVLFPLAQREPK